MEHLAILAKNRKLLAKIISGEKTIESRWLKNKSNPWDKIKKGEVIYFKESGEPVTAKAKVSEVKYFYLPNESIGKLFDDYGRQIGFTSIEHLKKYSEHKRYCVLVFLKDVKEIEPFEINKKGFGIMSAWICVDDAKNIKR